MTGWPELCRHSDTRFFRTTDALGLWAFVKSGFRRQLFCQLDLDHDPLDVPALDDCVCGRSFSCYLLAAFLAALYGRSFNLPQVRRAASSAAHANFWWWISGLSAGAAFGCKYPALLFVVIPIGPGNDHSVSTFP